MARAVETNLAMIKHVAERFGHLRERVVFLGGAATALLITDPATPDVRVTTDLAAEVAAAAADVKDFLSCTFKEFLQPLSALAWQPSVRFRRVTN